MRFLPARSSWVWPALPTLVPVVLIAVVTLTTRPTDRWTGSNSQTWVDDFVAGNPHLDLNVPDSTAIVQGRHGVYMPKQTTAPPRELATVRFSYTSDAIAVGLDRTGDGSDQFIDRAVGGLRHLEKQVPSNR